MILHSALYKNRGENLTCTSHAGLVEGAVCVADPIGHRLDPVVAEVVLRIADELREQGVEAGFTAAQDDLLGAQLVAPTPELRLDLLLGEKDVANSAQKWRDRVSHRKQRKSSKQIYG